MPSRTALARWAISASAGAGGWSNAAGIMSKSGLFSVSGAVSRIIHMALQNDASLTTKSRGEGEYRKIVIIPSKKN
jgi:hypothetical protein